MIIDDVATQANSLLIHHPDAITDFSFFMYSNSSALDEKRGETKTKRSVRKEMSILGNLVFMVREYH